MNSKARKQIICVMESNNLHVVLVRSTTYGTKIQHMSILKSDLLLFLYAKDGGERERRKNKV